VVGYCFTASCANLIDHFLGSAGVCAGAFHVSTEVIDHN
jgi:hypothetical protein